MEAGVAEHLSAALIGVGVMITVWLGPGLLDLVGAFADSRRLRRYWTASGPTQATSIQPKNGNG
jgi:hypothetical protein